MRRFRKPWLRKFAVFFDGSFVLSAIALAPALIAWSAAVTYANFEGTVHIGRDEAITALTDDGILKLKDMLAAVRASCSVLASGGSG